MPAQLEIGKLGVVTAVPRMQHVVVRRGIAFTPDLRMDVDYPMD